MAYEFYLTDSLEKVFLDQKPTPASLPETVLRGEKLQLQLVYCSSGADLGGTFQTLRLQTDSRCGQLFEVGCLPSLLPVWPSYDAGYLRTTPGLYPDLLTPSDGLFRSYRDQYRALWLSFDTAQLAAGPQEITLTITDPEAGSVIWQQTIAFTVLPVEQPTARLLHTEWFYVDSLADYYQLPPYCEKLWQIIENYIRFAAKNCDINVLLTPIFTPPLDTEIGQERTCVQLLTLQQTKDRFDFDFAKLRRWCRICRNAGITHLELPPLFTQWGAAFAPNIYLADGSLLFGWHTAATDPEYQRFLRQLLPELIAVLAEEGYPAEQLLFHLSDEPNAENLTSYKAARASVADLLNGYKVIDALSEYRFYEQGLVTTPVAANDALQVFFDHNTTNLWTYYCCAQTVAVPNRFFALPSYRNRVMGVLLYLYQIEGFLHWGFNFYSKQLSKGPLDPYAVTDAGGFFPSGDPFLVYPGDDGQPLSSLRNEVQLAGFADLAALQQLESVTDRQHVEALICASAGGKYPTFTEYPQNKHWLLALRQTVNKELAEYSGAR